MAERWRRQGRLLVLDGGAGLVAAKAESTGPFAMYAFGAHLADLPDEHTACCVVQRAVDATCSVGAWRDGWRTGMIEGMAAIGRAGLDADKLDVARFAVDHVLRRFPDAAGTPDVLALWDALGDVRALYEAGRKSDDRDT